MADTKISALSAVVSGSGSQRVRRQRGWHVEEGFADPDQDLLCSRSGCPRITQLTGQHSISSATGTEVTGLSQTLEAGTYVFRYHLIIRQATSTSDAPQFGVNFTGTSTTKNWILSWADATTALTGGTGIMDNVGIKTAGFMDAMAHNAVSTTAPNMGTTIGVAATGADILAFIDGLIIVTVSGDLELWRSAEGANASTTEVGSSLVVIRTA